jgi:hypothetical protein
MGPEARGALPRGQAICQPHIHSLQRPLISPIELQTSGSRRYTQPPCSDDSKSSLDGWTDDQPYAWVWPRLWPWNALVLSWVASVAGYTIWPVRSDAYGRLPPRSLAAGSRSWTSAPNESAHHVSTTPTTSAIFPTASAEHFRIAELEKSTMIRCVAGIVLSASTCCMSPYKMYKHEPLQTEHHPYQLLPRLVPASILHP